MNIAQTLALATGHRFEALRALAPTGQAPGAEFRRGLFAGSFDPMHFGHALTILKAAARCERLFVVVLNNVEKAGKYLFSHEERVEAARQMVKRLGLENVEVIGYDGLLVDLYLRLGCDAYIRGVRAGTADRKAEEGQAFLNTFIYDGAGNPNGEVNMVYIEETDSCLAAISSTYVKEFAAVDVPLPWMAPADVLAAVLRRRRGLIAIGVVGGIAVGKSTAVRALAAALEPILGQEHVHVVNIDGFVHEVYRGTSGGSRRVRELLVERFGPDVLTPDGKDVNRDALRTFLFGHPYAAENLRFVERLTEPHVMGMYRDFLRGKTGVVFVEMAQMVKMGMLHLVSNQVIVIDAPPGDADALATKSARALDLDVVRRMRAGQLTVAQQVEAIEAAIADEGGHLIRWDNAFRGPGAGPNVTGLMARVLIYVLPLLSELELAFPPDETRRRLDQLPRLPKR